MADAWVTPDYLAEFHCLGPDCEDTCCQSWDVHYDKTHYDVLLGKLAKIPPQREKILQHLHVTPVNTRKPSNYALIQFGNSRYCPFLATDKWCEIHRDFGVDALNDTCTFYPRVFSRQGSQTEMTGALSCPEVVRRCMTDTASSAWVNYEPALLPRRDTIPLARVIDTASVDKYQQGFKQVRACLLDLMQQQDYELETRLFFLASFANRLAADFHAGGACNEALLSEEIARSQDMTVLESLYDFYNSYSSDEPIAIIVIQSILQLQRHQTHSSGLEKMITEIFAHYAERLNGAGAIEINPDNIPPNKLHELFSQDWQLLNIQWGMVLDNCLSRYVVNCLQREWLISLPNPFVYVHLLTLRVAVLKFLITANKSMRDFVQSHRNRSEAERIALAGAFTEEVIAVTYQFARGIDQNLALLQVVYDALAEQQMMSFDYSLALIKF